MDWRRQSPERFFWSAIAPAKMPNPDRWHPEKQIQTLIMLLAADFLAFRWPVTRSELGGYREAGYINKC